MHYRYALNHPSVGYCQGMSDLASILLVTMKDEAHTYVCFCALMNRIKPNFHIDGDAMTLKFQHLTEALLYYDPEFFAYLQQHQVWLEITKSFYITLNGIINVKCLFKFKKECAFVYKGLNSDIEYF